MKCARIIPCLDVRAGRVVKGVRFQNLRDAGSPVEQASAYAEQGADEIVILDVSATAEERGAAHDTVRDVRAAISIPITVGGGVRAASDAAALLSVGAAKVSVNTAAVERPELLSDLSRRFGAQCTVLALDAARREDRPGAWQVVTHAGTRRHEIDAVEWARAASDRGAGEILLTSRDRDGTGGGYDLELLQRVSDAVPVPVIASGGASTPGHLLEALRAGADAVLAATIFHDARLTVGDLKSFLSSNSVAVRP